MDLNNNINKLKTLEYSFRCKKCNQNAIFKTREFVLNYYVYHVEKLKCTQKPQEDIDIFWCMGSNVRKLSFREIIDYRNFIEQEYKKQN